MKVSNINNSILFSGKIIDAHTHVGNWKGQQYSVGQLDAFVKSPLSNGDTIEKVIVSNLSAMNKEGMLDELSGNMEMLNIAKNNSKIAPLAVCQPKTGSVDNIKKLFKENPNKFIGLKFHPDGHEIIASSELFDPYLKFAQKQKLPCLFHCGIEWVDGHLVDEAFHYSKPEAIYEAAKKIPKIPVILAHLGAGGEQIHARAINVLLESIDKKDANLFADISWVDLDNPNKPTIIELIRKLKDKNALDKILFGSDAPIGEFSTGKNGLTGQALYDKTVVEIKSAIRNNFNDEADSIIDKIFYKNADNLFFKKTWLKTVSEGKHFPKKIVTATFLGLAAIGALCSFGAKHFSDNASSQSETSKSVMA